MDKLNEIQVDKANEIDQELGEPVVHVVEFECDQDPLTEIAQVFGTNPVQVFVDDEGECWIVVRAEIGIETIGQARELSRQAGAN